VKKLPRECEHGRVAHALGHSRVARATLALVIGTGESGERRDGGGNEARIVVSKAGVRNEGAEGHAAAACELEHERVAGALVSDSGGPRQSEGAPVHSHRVTLHSCAPREMSIHLAYTHTTHNTQHSTRAPQGSEFCTSHKSECLMQACLVLLAMKKVFSHTQ
jgi:hypothetical protein